MGYYDEKKSVQEYIEAAKNYDGSGLVEALQGWLPSGKAVLELGMGPGTDLDILSEHYQTTGSDLSQVFIDLYREKHSGAQVLNLDAVDIRTDLRFDAVYTNKVLHHLHRHQLKVSFANQSHILNDGGIAVHSFWKGDKVEEFAGLRFVYYELESVMMYFRDHFDLLEFKVYTELENEDSFYVVLRKRK